MKKILTLAIISLLLLSTFSIITPQVKAELGTWVTDDFSTDTGFWEYLGFKWPGCWGQGAEYKAYRDVLKEYVVLTPPEPHLAGVIWFKYTFTSPFTVCFRYLAGGGSGADGLVMIVLS